MSRSGPATVRIRQRPAILRYLVGLLLCVALLGALSSVTLTGRSLWLAVTAIAVIGGWLVSRTLRTEAVVTQTGVRATNPFGSLEVPWDEVERIEWHRHRTRGYVPVVTSARVRLVRREARPLVLVAATVFSERGADEVSRALHRTAGRAGVPIEPYVTSVPPARR